jgi:hypothetical protein
VTVLSNADATCSKIVLELEALAKSDNHIQAGDPILIYYAGYGGTVTIPRGWRSGSPELQVLVPYDAHVLGSRLSGVLTDCKIKQLLKDLAKKKGDNIVCAVFFISSLI